MDLSSGKNAEGECINWGCLVQIVCEGSMKRVREENLDGKTRDERETCFPVVGIKAK